MVRKQLETALITMDAEHAALKASYERGLDCAFQRFRGELEQQTRAARELMGQAHRAELDDLGHSLNGEATALANLDADYARGLEDTFRQFVWDLGTCIDSKRDLVNQKYHTELDDLEHSHAKELTELHQELAAASAAAATATRQWILLQR